MAHRQAIQSCGDIYYLFASTQEVASQVLKLRFPERNAAAPRRVSNLPYNSLGPLFKGRDVALAEIRERLMGRGRAVGLTASEAIHGLGGVGKTRLALCCGQVAGRSDKGNQGNGQGFPQPGSESLC
jgi:hypothetical protein